MKRRIRKVIAVIFAVAWCVVYPTSLFSIWYFNLTIGDALLILGASSGLTAITGLIDNHY